MSGEAKAQDVNMVVNNGRSANVQTKTDLEFSRMERKCTDIPCLVFFLLYMLGMLIIMGVSLGTGDPMRLIYGTDYQGSVCGMGPDEPSVRTELEELGKTPEEVHKWWKYDSWNKYYKARSAITYPRTSVDQLVQSVIGADYESGDLPGLPNFYGLCVEECPVVRAYAVEIPDTNGKYDSVSPPEDVVCSIPASATVMKVCTDLKFKAAVDLKNSVADTSFYRSLRDRNEVTRKTENKITFKYGDDLSDMVKERRCLADFYDLCHDGSDGVPSVNRTYCNDIYANQAPSAEEQAVFTAALDAVNGGDCWLQGVNSINVVNRCVASRAVDMEVICRDPKRVRKDSNGNIHYEDWSITEYENNGAGKDGKELSAQDQADLVTDGSAVRVDTDKGGISNTGYCASSYTRTKSVYGVKTGDLFNWLNGAGKTAAGWFADFDKTKTPILVAGIALSMVLGFAWIWFMKDNGFWVCWTTLVLSILMAIALNLCLYVKAGILGPDLLNGAKNLIAEKNPEIADQIPSNFPDYLQPSGTRRNLYKWTAIVFTAFILLCIVLMVRFRQKINVAIQMCKEAAKAIVSMPQIVFWPFMNVVALTLVMVYFVFIAMYIASAANLQNLNVVAHDKWQTSMSTLTKVGNAVIDGTNTVGEMGTTAYNDAYGKAVEQAEKQYPDLKKDYDPSKYSADDWKVVKQMSYNTTTVEPWTFEANKAIRGMLVYHTIGMWWAAMAIVAMGYFVISSAVGQWYFNTGKYLEHTQKRKKGVYDKNPTNCGCCKISCIQQIESPVFDSCKIVCSKHCGSIACGSGLNIIVYFAKIGMLWLNRLVSSLSGDKLIARKIKSCMFVTMLCFDKYVRIVSRNAYIMMAIRGQGFCKSAGWASWLIFAAQDNPKSLEEGAASIEKSEKARKKFNLEQTANISKLRNLAPGPNAKFQSISFVNGKRLPKPKEVTINTQQAKDRQLTHEQQKLTAYEGPYKEQSYNAAQYAVLSFITDILLFLGKVLVVGAAGVAAYAWVDAQYGKGKDAGELSSTAAPVAVAMLFSYFIVSAFMSVYDLAIDTILLCFFYDKLQNKGGPYAMSADLKKLVLNNLPPTINKANMRKGDSFFFSNQVTRRGTISIAAGWDAESKPDADSGQKVAQDVDLAMACFNHNAELIDYIGYMDCPAYNGNAGGMLLKKTAGGKLFPNRPDGHISSIHKDCVEWSGDDTTGAKSKLNVAGVNEDIKVRLHELPISVNTLAFVLFSFKGPTMDQISDLRLVATECTTSEADPGRSPEVVANFNMDFDEATLEGAQRAMLTATLRRNPGPKFPKGKHKFTDVQKRFADTFATNPVVKEDYIKWYEQNIEPQMGALGVTDAERGQIKAQVQAEFEQELDQMLARVPEAAKDGSKGRTSRTLQKQLDAHDQKVHKYLAFNILAHASTKPSHCGGKKKGLTAEQLMIYNNTYSKTHLTGDQIAPDEDYYDCAWELQAQRELMGMKKFNASCLNAIARKCFFFRDPDDKFKEAEGSFIGGAIAAGGALMMAS